MVEREKGKLLKFFKMTKCTTLTGNYAVPTKKKHSSPLLKDLGEILEGPEEHSP